MEKNPGLSRSRRNMYHLLRAIRPHLPDDIEVVHDYGCGCGGGVALLRRLYTEAKGFDIQRRWEDSHYADIMDPPQETADLIVTWGVFEVAFKTKLDPYEGIDNLLKRCRWLGIAVYKKYSMLNIDVLAGLDYTKSTETVDETALYAKGVGHGLMECDYYLIKGKL